MLEVFVVFYRDYDNAYVEGVYASMDAVRTAYPGTVTSNEARTYAEWRAWTAASAGPSAWQDFLADRYPQEWQGEPWCRNV